MIWRVGWGWGLGWVSEWAVTGCGDLRKQAPTQARGKGQRFVMYHHSLGKDGVERRLHGGLSIGGGAVDLVSVCYVSGLSVLLSRPQTNSNQLQPTPPPPKNQPTCVTIPLISWSGLSRCSSTAGGNSLAFLARLFPPAMAFSSASASAQARSTEWEMVACCGVVAVGWWVECDFAEVGVWGFGLSRSQTSSPATLQTPQVRPRLVAPKPPAPYI